jgi:hypothetical protein
MSKIETYSVKPGQPMPLPIWKIIHAFTTNRIEDGTLAIETGFSPDMVAQEPWMVAFDFCRLSGKTATLTILTEKYASIFNKAPPDWVSKSVSVADTNKGVLLNILSMTAPESEQYPALISQAADKKTALLIKFTPNRPLSWQELAASRLASGIKQLQQRNVPIYIENPQVVVAHMKTFPMDRRTDADWTILLYTLLFMQDESAFEEEALQFTLVKGISPPSFEKFSYPPAAQWFSAAGSDDDKSNVITAQGALLNDSTLVQRIKNKLQKHTAVIVDMRAVTQIDWKTLSDLLFLFNQVVDSNSRKMYFAKPSPLLHKVLQLSGIPDSIFVEAK